jgi:hypothetical protein
MSALAAYRTAVLALLYDATNVIFSNDNVDTALRWALAEYSVRRPLIRTYMLDVDTTTVIHVLPADFATRHITKVELYNADPDAITERAFYAYIRDEQWTIETKLAVEAGEVLQVSYSDTHTVDGLDSASGTTVPEADEYILQVGAAGRAAQMRALDRIETINMNKDVVAAYQKLALDYLLTFTQYSGSHPSITISPLPEFPEVVF